MVTAWVRKAHHVDVIILTVLPSEFDAVLQVNAGAAPGSEWDRVTSPSGLPIAFRPFMSTSERPLRIAVARSPDPGATAATNTLLPLIEELGPRCIAMCGVCAGRRDEVQLGDVVAADRLYYHDTGKLLSSKVQQDLTTYKLRDDWKAALGAMDAVARFRNQPWFQTRPLSTEWREHRALIALRDGAPEPWLAVDPGLDNHAWRAIVGSLRAQGLMETTGRELTVAGRHRADDLEFEHQGRLPDPSPAGAVLPFRLHVAPIASGVQMEDEAVWGFITPAIRSTLALETEGAALAELAHRQRRYGIDAIVMKGVMDFAHDGRDPHFEAFAARASAECLLAFLREQITAEVAAGFDDLLTPGTSLVPTGEVSPSSLLLARHAIVPWFDGDRGKVLDGLDAWADAPECHVSVKLLHGAGGVGKTRLAIEWVQRRRRKHDVAGFLMADPGPQWLERLCRLGPPVLVVIDYAERRADLIDLLERVAAFWAAEGPRRRVRILLLARNDGGWWKELLGLSGSVGALLRHVTPEMLPPLAAAKHDRETVFREASAAFAAIRGRRDIPEPPIALTGHRFKRVLYLHMAALAAVEGASFNALSLMDVILDHEEHFWLNGAKNRNHVAVNLPIARQIMAAATLRGVLPTQAVARDAFDRLAPWRRTAEDEAQLELLHRVYERTIEPAFLLGLEPDLLGEAMVLRVAQKLDANGAGRTWITSVFVPHDNETSLTTAFTVLGRVSVTAAQAVRPWIIHLLLADLPRHAVLALRAAKKIGHDTAWAALGNLLAEVLEQHGDADIAVRLGREEIPSQTVSLQRVADWRSKKLFESVSSGEDSIALSRRAHVAEQRARAIDARGQRGAAIAPMQEAVNLYRRLTRRGHNEFQLHLAASLSNLGSMLGDLGQRDQALIVALEAVDLYRSMSGDHPDVHDAGLALSLNNLGTIWNALGDHSAALAVLRGAVELYRTLATRDPAVFHAKLATSLNNLGIALAGNAQDAKALEVTQEAVKLYRGLAKDNPDAFEPDLAWTYHNLGLQLSRVKQHDAAYKFTSTAVQLYRKLTAWNTDAFQDRLAMSLNNLGMRASERGDREAAIAAMQEAVGRYSRLAEQNPDRFNASLAVCLNNLGRQLDEAGRHAEALNPTRQAVEIYRHLAVGHQPTLIGLAPARGITFRDLAPLLPPLDPSDELADHRPTTITWKADVFQCELARSLAVLSHRCANAGQLEAAVAAARDAVDRYRGPARRKPAVFVPEVVKILNHLSDMLSGLGRRDEALAVAREAVDRCRGLVARSAEAFEPVLAKSLGTLSHRLSRVGYHEIALAAAHEAVSLFRKLAGRTPEEHQPDLAHSLSILGLRRREVGQTSGAIIVSQEAVAIYRTLATQNPEMYQSGLAASLNKLGLLLSEGSRHQEALDAIHEAVDLRRTLADRSPSGLLPLVKSLRNLGHRLDELGQRDAALAARREADQLYLNHPRMRPPATELTSTGMHALAGAGSYR